VVPFRRGVDADLWNAGFLYEQLDRAETDVVAHLAAVSSAPEAAADPGLAMRTNVGGTQALLEAVRRLDRPVGILVAGSSEVYGAPAPEHLPLDERSPLAPISPYALSKLAQEAVAIEGAFRYDIPVVVTRAFNHTGPGQRPVFAVPAFASRVLDVMAGRADSVRAGNVDVRRDLGDVRDVVVAYRQLLEKLHRGGLDGPLIANVSTGRSVSMREVIDGLLGLIGIEAPIEIDQALVRDNDPPEIRGNSGLLHGLVGWEPAYSLEATLRDVLGDVRSMESA
jgi:GDP-4-dehydro-6-deoxy-D-mannose reductase